MSLEPGTRLGPYVIAALIGRGGMGEVYRARDPRIGRDVALKILPAAVAADPERIARFELEARAMGALVHPNVVRVYDVGTAEGQPYIVGELVEGSPLRAALDEGPLELATCMAYATQIARGLGAAHANGIVHRDLKPENLIVTPDGRIMIVDFGIAKLVQASEDEATMLRTETGTTLGTAGYMAPEQIRNAPVDARADLFALGAILYEMLAGERAFRGASAAEIMSAILRDDPVPLASRRSDVPPVLDQLVRACLEKEPGLRPPSAAAIEQTLLGLPSGDRPRRRARPARPALIVAGMLLVLAAIAGVVLQRGAPPIAARGPRFASLAVLPLEDFSHDPGQAWFSDGMTEALISKLAQVGSVRVISRTSIMQYKGSTKPLRQIARELGVDGVIEGSVMHSGERVRITAQLVDGRTDQHVWAHDYESDARDVLAMQSDVAQAIAREVRAQITPGEQVRLARARRIIPAAQEDYLKGRYFAGIGTEEAIGRAIALYQQAIALDSTDARPWAGLSDAYALLRSIYRPPHEVMPAAIAAARRAVTLDDSLAEGHVSLGSALMFYDFDWVGAERELRRALALNPNLAEAHDGLALFDMANERHAEATAEIERALTLDPLSSVIQGDAAWVYYGARRYERSLELAQQMVEASPDLPWGYAYRGIALERLGRAKEAIADLERAARMDNSVTILELLGGAYATAGRKADARRVVAQLTGRARTHYVCPYEVATVYAGLGDRDHAFAWLRRGVAERADCMPWIRADAKIDSLRADPRYLEVLRSVRLDRPRS